ncbi:hypothetical protein, partial [Aeromonas media]|uniref:hypothetical protein n=1 Tax=Aeromonas media TaxID=651 RepID=UPI003D248A70
MTVSISSSASPLTPSPPGSTLPAAILDDKVHKGLTEALQLTMTDADDRQHLVIGIATDPI